MICLDIGPLQICTGEWPNENTTRKSKCHHYVPSLCNQVYFAVSESREIWAYAPERSKIKYPDISSKEEAKREEKKKKTHKFLINGRSLASSGASWCRWGWGSGSNPMCPGITDAEHGTKAAWRRFSLEYFTEPRLSIHPFLSIPPSFPPALWKKQKLEGTKTISKSSSYRRCWLKSSSKRICCTWFFPLGTLLAFWADVHTCKQ